MRQIQLVALFAVFTFAVVSVAVAGPKGQGPAKANIHAQKGLGKAAKGQAGKTGTAGVKAGKADKTAHADKTAKTAKADKAEKSARAEKSIAANIEKNAQLEARIKSMLPADMTIAQASEGFRNQGQFIAAVNASKNHDIPFADLKAQMTGDSALSLGQAVQKLRPGTDTSADADTDVD
jgi:hypothetical protein